MATKLNENSEVALPLRNIISLIAAAAVATWAYFGIVERLNKIETNITINTKLVPHLGCSLEKLFALSILRF